MYQYWDFCFIQRSTPRSGILRHSAPHVISPPIGGSSPNKLRISSYLWRGERIVDSYLWRYQSSLREDSSSKSRDPSTARQIWWEHTGRKRCDVEFCSVHSPFRLTKCTIQDWLWFSIDIFNYNRQWWMHKKIT